jgi:hypothetical protein
MHKTIQYSTLCYLRKTVDIINCTCSKETWAQKKKCQVPFYGKDFLEFFFYFYDSERQSQDAVTYTVQVSQNIILA